MLIATSFNDKGTLLVLGLSRENRERLGRDQLIFLSRETHGMAIPKDLEICIFAGETEESMKEQLKDFISSTTVLDQKKPI